MKYIIGVDEVGRGPLAGPVAVGAFVFMDKKIKNLFKNVKESKQLSEKQREKWFKIIEEAKQKKFINFSVVFRSEKIIDNRGLAFALKSALKEAIDSIKIIPQQATILLDGGLRAPAEYLDQKTIIKGDEKEMVIALASICAKVLRDRKMIRLDRKFPNYGFAIHKGYGTKKHYEAIKKYGLLKEHRKSFIKL